MWAVAGQSLAQLRQQPDQLMRAMMGVCFGEGERRWGDAEDLELGVGDTQVVPL